MYRHQTLSSLLLQSGRLVRVRPRRAVLVSENFSTLVFDENTGKHIFGNFILRITSLQLGTLKFSSTDHSRADETDNIYTWTNLKTKPKIRVFLIFLMFCSYMYIALD